MRILLSKNSKELLFDYLLKIKNCSSLQDLSLKIKVPFKTLQNWKYENHRYLPESIVPEELIPKLEIIDRREDNWGKIKGGKITYSIILKKYGIDEIKKRQVNGGKKSIKLNRFKPVEDIIHLDLTNEIFLEFYGALFGDGWLSRLKYKCKTINLIGFSGNAKKDRPYFVYLQKNIKELFNRTGYLKERPKYNAIELTFNHKDLIKKLNEEINFPIGQKYNLQIPKPILDLGSLKTNFILRGVFDTDGCLYFDKTPVGRPYPCISIVLKEHILIGQIKASLIQQGFKVQHRIRNNGAEEIKLKGLKQVNKWMKEIGSSNKRNLDKYASVAQLDRAKAS